jgi:dephospho-CoA kinase
MPKHHPPHEWAKDYVKEHGIVITGGIATGKSTVAHILRNDHKKLVLDADVLARQAVIPGSSAIMEIVQKFGPQYLDSTGGLDRKKVRELITQDSSAKAKIEGIVQPEIQRLFMNEVISKFWNKPPEDFFYEAALIHEARRSEQFKEVWCTICPREVQISRLMDRETESQGKNPNKEVLEKLVDSQWPQEHKAHLSDKIIDTNCTIDALKTKIATMVKKN